MYFGRPYFTLAIAWAQAKMKPPRPPCMTTFDTQAPQRLYGATCSIIITTSGMFTHFQVPVTEPILQRNK